MNDTYEATGEMYNRVIRHLLKGTDKENHMYDVRRGPRGGVTQKADGLAAGARLKGRPQVA